MKPQVFDITEELNSIFKEENKVPVLDRVLRDSKIKTKDAKIHHRWMKKTIKQLKSLKKEKVIYIYDHSSFEESVSWLDISIAFRTGLFRQLQSKWVFTALDRKSFKSDQKAAIENGGEYPEKMFDPDWPTLYFDDIYLDVPGFKSEADVIAAFKEWAKVFIPFVLDKEIRFEEKEAFLFRNIYENWKFKRSFK